MGCSWGGDATAAAEGSNAPEGEVFTQLAPPLVDPHGPAPPPREGAAVSETFPIQTQLQVIKAQHNLAKAVKADDVIRELVLSYYR